MYLKNFKTIFFLFAAIFLIIIGSLNYELKRKVINFSKLNENTIKVNYLKGFERFFFDIKNIENLDQIKTDFKLNEKNLIIYKPAYEIIITNYSKEHFDLNYINLKIKLKKKLLFIIFFIFLFFLFLPIYLRKKINIIQKIFFLLFKKIYSKFETRSEKFVFFFSLITFFIISNSYFFPNIEEIIPYDETVYFNAGRDLVTNLDLWPYDRGPLISIIYGFYFLLSKFFDQYWVLTVATISRIINFFILFFSSYLIYKKIHAILDLKRINSLFYLIFLFPFFPLYSLVNPGHILFISFASFTFYVALELYFCEDKNLKELTFLFSLFLGVIGLCRPDTNILFPAMLIFYLFFIISIKKIREFKEIFKYVLVFVLPFLFFVEGYKYFISYATNTPIQRGSKVKLYLAFEHSHHILLSDQEKQLPFVQTQVLTEKMVEKMYGSKDDNNWSVIKAISKNPKFFLNKQIKSFGYFFPAGAEAVTNFNLDKFYIVLIFFIIGIFFIFFKSKLLFFLIFFWLSHLLPYFLTLIYGAYIWFIFFISSVVCFVGLNLLIKNKSIFSTFALLLISSISIYLEIYLITFSLIGIIILNFLRNLEVNIIPRDFFYLIPVIILTFSLWGNRVNLHLRDTAYKEEINEIVFFLKENTKNNVLSYTHLIPSIVNNNRFFSLDPVLANFSIYQIQESFLMNKIDYFIADKDFIKDNPWSFQFKISEMVRKNIIKLIYSTKNNNIKVYGLSNSENIKYRE